MMQPSSSGLAPLREVLRNGAVVLAKETRTTPAVTISVAFPAGGASDPPDVPGLAHFLSRVIDRGTASRSGDALAEELESRGVGLSTTATRHSITLLCSCLTDDVEPVLRLIAEIARTPVFPEDEVAKRRAEIVTMLRQDEDNPAVRAVEGMFELLYGSEHPYGRRSKGTFESVGRIDRAALVRFHQAHFSPGSLSLALVGDLRPGEAIAAAVRAFGDWGGAPALGAPVPQPRPVSGRRRLVLPMMNKAQADIAYGFTTIRRADPAYYAFALMNNILGQYGLGGRLGDNIRERQGMAYYAFSAFDASLGEGPLFIRAGVSPGNVDRAVAAIDEEVTRMATEGVTAAELEDAKRFLIGSLPRTLETNAGIASFLQMIEQFGLGLDYDRQLPELLGGVAREQVHAAATRVLDPERATLVIAGPYGADAPAAVGEVTGAYTGWE